MAHSSSSAEATARRWLTPRQRKLVVACAAAVGVVAAYKLYRSERLKSTQQALQAAAHTLGKYQSAAAAAGDVAAVLAEDIRTFLASDSDEVPRSLRQLAKLARCAEVQDTVAAFVASSIKGVVSSSSLSGTPGEPSLVDKLIEAVLSDRGQSLVGLAVRTAACQSSEVFCRALQHGITAAMQAAGVGQQPQQQQMHSPAATFGPASPGPHGAFFSAASSPMPSPQRYHGSSPHTLHIYAGQAGPVAAASALGMPSVVGSVLSLMSSPQLLQAVDALVSTCVGSTVGAYMAQAGSSSDMLGNMLHTLAQPANKRLVIDIMSQVSAVFCREMAAACVAPASAVVSSRPASRLSDAPSLIEQQLRLQEHLASATASPAAAGPSVVAAAHGSSPQRQQQQQVKPPPRDTLHHSVSERVLSSAPHGGDDQQAAIDTAAGKEGAASEPSSPQSGPSTPEPSVAAAEAAGASSSALQQQQAQYSSYSSFAGSAVAGLIMRRPSISGLLSGAAGGLSWGNGGMQPVAAGTGSSGMHCAAGAVGGPVLVDPTALGPLSTVVTLFVQAARFQEFRSLMVDVSRSSTREFVLSLLPSGWSGAVGGRRHGGGSRSSRSNDAAAAALTAALYRVYTSVSVLLFLMVYALGPKTLLEGGSA